MKPQSFTIPRDTWLRGTGTAYPPLRNTALGFYALASGCRDEELWPPSCAQLYIFYQRNLYGMLAGREHTLTDSDLADELRRLNSDSQISDEDREFLISQLFGLINVEVMFQ